MVFVILVRSCLWVDLLQGSDMQSTTLPYCFIHLCFREGGLTCHWSVFLLCWAGNLATSRARVTAASRSLPPQLNSGRNKVCAAQWLLHYLLYIQTFITKLSCSFFIYYITYVLVPFLIFGPFYLSNTIFSIKLHICCKRKA